MGSDRGIGSEGGRITQFLPIVVIGASALLALCAAGKLAGRRGIAREHWFGLVFLIPFPCMLALHQWLGLPDAVMVGAQPGERPAHFYNLVMVGVFFGGAVGCFVQPLIAAPKSQGWQTVQFLPLAAYCAPLFWR